MQSCGKSSNAAMGMPDLQAGDYFVCVAQRATDLHQPVDTLNNPDKNGAATMHPECSNPPTLTGRFTDEDYALVCNVWRRELGLGPLV